MLTQEQLAARKGKITSSVAAGALGLNPRMTPIQAWENVLGLSTFGGNKATDRGNRLEDITLDYPADELDLVRLEAPFRAHPTIPWMADSADAAYATRAEPDRIIAIGEGKTAAMGVASDYGEEGTDEVSAGALVQAHHHLIHWPEVDTCYVPVLVGGYAFEFRLYEVRRDEAFEGAMVEELAKWHRDYVVTERPPPVTADDGEWLKKRYPAATDGMMADTPEIAEWVEKKIEAAARMKAAEADEELAKNKLRELLGEHEGVKASWGTLWNKVEAGKPAWKRIAEELGATPALIAQHTSEGHRVLRLYPTKKK